MKKSILIALLAISLFSCTKTNNTELQQNVLKVASPEIYLKNVIAQKKLYIDVETSLFQASLVNPFDSANFFYFTFTTPGINPKNVVLTNVKINNENHAFTLVYSDTSVGCNFFYKKPINAGNYSLRIKGYVKSGDEINLTLVDYEFYDGDRRFFPNNTGPYSTLLKIKQWN